MTYKKKLVFLSALIVILATVYILSLVFDPENRRDKTIAWLDSTHHYMADGIEISGSEGKFVFSRINNAWFLREQRGDLPVKQEKVEDLFAQLSLKNVKPIKLSTSEAVEKLGLTEDKAYRITIRGGAGFPLLDLLIGLGDALGREVYLKRADWNQIYSAEDGYSSFTGLKPTSWYDLRLLPRETNLNMVQQVDISLSDSGTFVLRRSGSGWIVPGSENLPLDAVRVDAWLRMVLEVEGEDFGFEAPEAFDKSITLRLGDGSTLTLQAGPIEEGGIRRVVVSGSAFVYIFSEWKINSIFWDSSLFLKAP